MTKHDNGAEVVDVKAKLKLKYQQAYRLYPNSPWTTRYARSEHSTIIVRLERASRKRLPLLTCHDCGHRKGRGLDGFLDHQFNQKLLSRYCFACQKRRKSGVNEDLVIDGIPKMWCHICEEIKNREQAASKPLVDRLQTTITRRNNAAWQIPGFTNWRSGLSRRNDGVLVCKSCCTKVTEMLGMNDTSRPLRKCRLA